MRRPSVPARAALRIPLLAAAVAAALLPAAPAGAATIDVQVVDFQFNPQNVTIQVGDTVRWTSLGGHHNVRANDGSFRCANGCDGEGGNGTPANNLWMVTRTFTQAGTVGYYCELHGGPTGLGMAGTITVQGSGGGGEQRGSLSFTAGSFSVAEGAGSRTVTVRRTGGDDGAVSVAYATANGSAGAGTDYTARSGTLSWADGDDDTKSFSVPILDDGAVEGSETVNLTLSSPGGGAALGSPATATLTITDNDSGGGGGVPAAPTNLRATAQSTSEILLAWTDASANETEFRIERRALGGTFQQVATAPAGNSSLAVGGLPPATGFAFRVRAANAAGASPPSNEATAATDAPIAPCLADADTLCLNGNRFQVEVDWRTATTAGSATAIPLSFAPDSGLFFFFQQSNIELLVKVLNACVDPFNRYWVFWAATTNVELTLTVIDTQTGRTRVYFNPLNQAAAPVQDVDAFATCP